MAITRIHSDDQTEYSTGATSVSVTIDNSVSTGDMIVIPYFTRSAPTTPSGFTNHANIEYGGSFGGTTGFHVKISDGTEGGTSVTVAQASSGRIEAYHCIFSGSSLSVSGSVTDDFGTSSNGTASTITEDSAFLAICSAANEYTAAGDESEMISDAAGSDAEWGPLNTIDSTPASSDSGRLWGLYAIYASGGTTALNLEYPNYTGSKDWGAAMISVVEGAADTTAPTLTSASGTQTGATTADLSVSTDEGNGTLYWVVTTSATSPSVAQVKAGQDHTGTAAVDSGSQSVTTTGTQNASATGLTASTAYYVHFQHVDAAANDSTVATSASFTTTAAATVVKGARVTLYSGSTAQASITGITAMWWDSSPPTGTPVFTTATASTDGSGVLELDIDADTALDLTDPGHLKVYKLDGTDEKDSIAWQGRLLVQDIS